MKTKKQTFAEYYGTLCNADKTFLRNVIIRECGISPYSFYPKMADNTKHFNKLERERIAYIVERPVDELFPE